ncbi:MAG: hypothetical protein CSA26_04785 [Desulfobacterales bacterium]|nr:MAG: hypothetical protein CSA26_04785 [Desulfobacterales bacterium]
MIIIVSPSKTQTFTNRQPADVRQPELIDRAEQLIAILKSFSPEDLATLMKTSERLTAQTIDSITGFQTPHTTDNSSAALTVFQGAAYTAVDTDSYNKNDYLFADRHVRILSGLYGILRPTDLIQPYRLEMGTRLETDRGASLYDFWGETITDILNRELEQSKERFLVNCASKEYANVIRPKKIAADLITVSFKQRKNDRLKTIAVHAKRARGRFVDYVIRNRLTNMKKLQSFNEDGYCFSTALSSDTELVFQKSLD